jgi:hypothetical protein
MKEKDEMYRDSLKLKERDKVTLLMPMHAHSHLKP